MSTVSFSSPPGFINPCVESLPPPPPRKRDFSNRLDGVIIPVWQGDIYLAQACCASVRQSMGDIPITLLVDGVADTRDLQRLHGVQEMVIQEVADEEFVRLCTGNPWTKLLPFWMSPYERFLCLDADLLVWGDLREYAEFDKYDFIVTYHNPGKFDKPEDILGCINDPAIFKKLDPQLDWQGKDILNTGVFFARRGIFSRETLMDLRKLNCWPCFESGVFHYFHWRGLREGKPRTMGHKLQLYPAEKKYGPEDRFLPRNRQDPAVIHWITKKPKLGRSYKAHDDYRKLFLKMTGRKRFLRTRLLMEDIKVWAERQRRSMARKAKAK